MKNLLPLLILFVACHPVRNLQVVQPEARITGDTIHEQMLITYRPMGFARSYYGLAIVRDDTCRAHLYCNGRRIKSPFRVWNCETKLNREGDENAYKGKTAICPCVKN